MGQAELKEFRFPTGGIADFYLEEHEKEALFKKKAEENFGNSGIANFDSVATRMASYGRYGDDKLVHAETGELVVPKALIENNPELRDSIFGHLKDMGIEDPERYVVGSRANSINPDTGLPEFFLKDIFDRVGDVIRKVAKPVLTIAGSVFFGPVYGAALGAGIGGLIQGESLEQAFGSALTAGAGGALTAGVTGMFGEAGFRGGIEEALKGGTYSDILAREAPSVAFDKAQTVPGIAAKVNIPKQDPGVFSKLFPKTFTAQDVADINPTLGEKLTPKLASSIAKEASPGFLAKYAAPTALATTAAAAGGFFDAPEMEELEDFKTGQDLIDENRGKYIVQGTDIVGAQPPFMVPTRFPFTPQPSPPITFAAKGGDVFPRRNGGIGPEEGTPGEDSVRAMLMPGEFVMTTDAVKGAGGGDLNRGINNMYSMMRNFEAKARA